jgi:hypothetical protein
LTVSETFTGDLSFCCLFNTVEKFILVDDTSCCLCKPVDPLSKDFSFDGFVKDQSLV